MDAIRTVEEAYKREIPPFNVGDTVNVITKVIEGGKEREQSYKGVVIARRGSGTRETITVRKISYGIGVERIFPLHSPMIKAIECIRRGDVRRAKFYYLRHKKGKAAKLKEKIYDYKEKGKEKE